MSHPLNAVSTGRDGERKSQTFSGESGREILELFTDPNCHEILEATAEETLTASEISERRDIPMSTTYRKLEELAEKGLIVEQTRICMGGKHKSEYGRLAESVEARVGNEGFVVDVTLRRVSQRSTQSLDDS